MCAQVWCELESTRMGGGGGYLSITVPEEEGRHIGVEGKYRWPCKKETQASAQIEGTEPRRKLPSTEAWREGHGRGRGN